LKACPKENVGLKYRYSLSKIFDPKVNFNKTLVEQLSFYKLCAFQYGVHGIPGNVCRLHEGQGGHFVIVLSTVWPIDIVLSDKVFTIDVVLNLSVTDHSKWH